MVDIINNIYPEQQVTKELGENNQTARNKCTICYKDDSDVK